MRIQIRYHEPGFSKKAKAEIKRVAYHEARIDYLLWALEPDFYFSSAGVFLTHSKKITNGSDYGRLTEKYGKFRAEGLVNHIHLNHIVRNPIWQFEIGLRAIKSWGNKIESSRLQTNTVIYLNEDYETSRRVNYTLCVYSAPSKSDSEALERNWKRKVTVLTFKQFLNWTKREYSKLKL